MELPRRRFPGVNFATAANFVAGLWLIAAPWVFGASVADAGAWWSVLVGGAIAAIAVLRSTAGPRAAMLSWVNAFLGASMIASLWIFHYADQSARAWNSGVVGVLVVVLACIAETAPEAWGKHDDDYQRSAGWDYPYSAPADRPGDPPIYYEAADYGQAGLGDPERKEVTWSALWHSWIFGTRA